LAYPLVFAKLALPNAVIPLLGHQPLDSACWLYEKQAAPLVVVATTNYPGYCSFGCIKQVMYFLHGLPLLSSLLLLPPPSSATNFPRRRPHRDLHHGTAGHLCGPQGPFRPIDLPPPLRTGYRYRYREGIGQVAVGGPMLVRSVPLEIKRSRNEGSHQR